MDSPSFAFLENRIRNSTDGISPVTDLTNNLNFLSTESTLSTEITPCRRLSWSNPFPSEKKSKSVFGPDSPFEVNSPSVEEGILRDREQSVNSGVHLKKKAIKPLRKFLFRNSVYNDKENLDEENSSLKTESKHKSLSSEGRNDSQSDLSGASQESGYYESASSRCSEASFFSPASMPSVRSSVFTDDELEEDDAFFRVDKFIEEAGESIFEKSNSSMTQLLTKPLADSFNSPKLFGDGDIENSDIGALRKDKPLFEANSCTIGSSWRQWEFNSTAGIVLQEMSPSCSSELEDKFNENSLKLAFKRPEPIDDLTPLQAKRRRSSPSVAFVVQEPANHARLHRCYSESAATIMRAVQKSDQEPNLIGDCSRPFSLPLISGRHQDLKTISCETLAKLLRGEYRTKVRAFTIVDCRYPYEFEGGHIVGAKNIYTKESLYTTFLSSAHLPENESDQNNITVFHCEFSSERAPKLLRYLRSKDRELNEEVYPRLHHPEIYLLEGGYRAFFENFRDMCFPQSYKPMLHKDHSKELREFRSKSKSFSQDSKGRPMPRSNLKF